MNHFRYRLSTHVAPDARRKQERLYSTTASMGDVSRTDAPWNKLACLPQRADGLSECLGNGAAPVPHGPRTPTLTARAAVTMVPQDGSKQRFGLPASDEWSYSIRVSILHTPGTTITHADASVTISLRAPHRHPRRLRTRPTPPNIADQFRALRVGPSGPLAYW